MSSDGPDDRPTIIALAGSNGAGKSIFYETQLASLGWPFINADQFPIIEGLQTRVAELEAKLARFESDR